MKVTQKPFNSNLAKADITGIVEVWLPCEIWQRMSVLRKKKPQLTFSWITRFVLFHMIRKKNFFKNENFPKLVEHDQNNIDLSLTSNHRHKLCLYGDDETFLKYLSLFLRVPMSALIRIALRSFLHLLDTSKTIESQKRIQHDLISWDMIVKNGTKIVKNMIFFGTQLNPWPNTVGAQILKFKPTEFW